MKYLALLLIFFASSAWGALPCPQTVGTLTLRVTQPRAVAISPALFFFDATTSSTTRTTGGNNNAINDIYYTWDFGDTGISGQGIWSAGANGQPNKNKATGPIAAHNYVLPTTAVTDTPYTVTVGAYDGANTVNCTVSVTVQAPSGSNGFAGTNTICATNAASVPAGCPSGATSLTSVTTLPAALASFGSGKRVLLHCGDIFTGNFNISNTVTKASIGAFGSPDCSNTSTNRPISHGTLNWLAGANTQFSVPTDIRVTDIDFEDTTGNQSMVWQTYCGGCFPNVTLGVKQGLMYNLNCAGANQCYGVSAMSQSGIINSNATCVSAAGPQCVFPNFGENNCNSAHGGGNSTTWLCGAASYDPTFFTDVSYNAFIGNNFNGTTFGGSGGGGEETFRISACRYCVITNNTSLNANNAGAVFKFHNGQTIGSRNNFIGQYTEYVEISDNLWSGNSGTQLVEVCAQNNVTDERLRFINYERNFASNNQATKQMICGQGISVRNNVTYLQPSATGTSDYQYMMTQRGTVAETAPVSPLTWPSQNIEFYNNTCYFLTTQTNCGGFVGGIDGTAAAANSSFGSNTLFYANGVTGKTPVANTGTGNTVSNNSANTATNPNMKNASGGIGGAGALFKDFIPNPITAGLQTVPVYFDGGLFSTASAMPLGAFTNASGNGLVTVLFSQPTETGIAGNFGVQVTPPAGQWFMNSLQPSASGSFVANPNSVSALTGFAPVNPSTAQMSASSAANVTTAQMEGNTVGAYINTNDIQNVNNKMMITPTYTWVTQPFPFAGNKTLSTSFNLQVPVVTGVPVQTPPVYIRLDLLFTDSVSGKQISYGMGIFRQGGTAVATPTPTVDGPTGNYLLNPFLAHDTTYGTATSGVFHGATWTGFLPFGFTISPAQFQAGLTLMLNTFPSGANQFTGSQDPTKWTLTKVHLNAEIQIQAGGPFAMGWSMNGLTITQQ